MDVKLNSQFTEFSSDGPQMDKCKYTCTIFVCFYFYFFRGMKLNY